MEFDTYRGKTAVTAGITAVIGKDSKNKSTELLVQC